MPVKTSEVQHWASNASKAHWKENMFNFLETWSRKTTGMKRKWNKRSQTLSNWTTSSGLKRVYTITPHKVLVSVLIHWGSWTLHALLNDMEMAVRWLDGWILWHQIQCKLNLFLQSWQLSWKYNNNTWDTLFNCYFKINTQFQWLTHLFCGLSPAKLHVKGMCPYPVLLEALGGSAPQCPAGGNCSNV